MTLTILCCHLDGQIRMRTQQALEQHAVGNPDVHVHFTTIKPDDPFQYGREIASWWELAALGNFDLAIVEPDIVIRDDVIDAFLNCECEYAAFPYPWLTDVGPALGCTRFRHAFMAANHDAVEKALAHNVGFRQFDTVFMRWILARDLGLQPHVHLPQVEHLNPEKALLPEADPTPLMSVPLY